MIGEAKELLAQLSAEPSAQELARQREEAFRLYQFELNVAREQGEKEGIEKGRMEGKLAIAANLLRAEMSTEQVVSLTGLSIEDIETLLKKFSH